MPHVRKDRLVREWVDFHWEVDGEMYEFTLPGGGFVSLRQLVEVLGIAGLDVQGEISDENMTENAGIEDNNDVENVDEVLSINSVEISEATEKFVSDVESVVFSSQELVWIRKIYEDTSVGALKDANGLEVQYSAELTQEQIEEINAQTVNAGDWALISLLPFETEESLTVTMKNGEQILIRVTDATYYSITFGTEVSPTDAGTITASSFTTKTGDSNHGTNNNSITAKASSGYIFDHWELDDVEVTENENITTQSDGSKSVISAGGLFIGDSGEHTLKAVFKTSTPSVYTFTVTVDDASHGTLTGIGADSESYTGVSSYVAVSKSIESDDTAVNKNSISLTTKVRYQFVRWELRDTDGTVISTYSNSDLAAEEVTLTKDNLTLVALFEERPTTDISVTEIDTLIDQWEKELTKTSNMLKAEKTAEVYDYENRIYEIDITASSGKKVIEPDVSLNFITDTSRSMYFPATISEKASNVTNLYSWLTTNQSNGDITTSDVFYVIGDVNNTATMYAVYYDSGWKVTDASYYKADDNKTSTVYNASSITNSVNGKTLTGTIYTSAAKPSQVGSLWSRLSYLYKAVEKAAYIIYTLSPDSEIGLTTFNATAKYEETFGCLLQNINVESCRAKM